jgi:hypothetical protein
VFYFCFHVLLPSHYFTPFRNRREEVIIQELDIASGKVADRFSLSIKDLVFDHGRQGIPTPAQLNSLQTKVGPGDP